MNSKTSESRTPVHGEVHTPGPWGAWPVECKHIGGMVESQMQIVSDPVNGLVSHLATMVDCDGYSTETVEANARLICAAPQMQAALREIADERVRIEQLLEDHSPGTMEHRLAESLLDTLDSVQGYV